MCGHEWYKVFCILHTRKLHPQKHSSPGKVHNHAVPTLPLKRLCKILCSLIVRCLQLNPTSNLVMWLAVDLVQVLGCSCPGTPN